MNEAVDGIILVIMMLLNDVSFFTLVFHHMSYSTSENIQYLKGQLNKMDLSHVLNLQQLQTEKQQTKYL